MYGRVPGIIQPSRSFPVSGSQVAKDLTNCLKIRQCVLLGIYREREREREREIHETKIRYCRKLILIKIAPDIAE